MFKLYNVIYLLNTCMRIIKKCAIRVKCRFSEGKKVIYKPPILHVLYGFVVQH